MIRSDVAWPPKRHKFWAEIPNRALGTLAIAVGVTFASIGFLGDIASIDDAPFSNALYGSIISAVAAVTMFLSFARHSSWMFVSLAIIVLGWMFQAGPALNSPFVWDPAMPPRVRLQVDSALAILMVLAGYNAFILFITREGRRLVAVNTELALARKMHRTLVPRVETSMADISFLGVSDPSGAVGGDIVDVIALPDGRWLAYVADVSGHGVSSGLVMGMVKSAVRMALFDAIPMPQLANRLNRLLSAQLDAATYVTFAAIERRADGRFEALTAGHPPLLVFEDDGSVEQVATDNVPFGFVEDWTFVSTPVDLTPSSTVALVTDGLFEVFDRRGRDLGLESLTQGLAVARTMPLDAIATTLFEQVRQFGPQQDDQSLLLIRRSGGG
jgi:serine phosphatase RsbU (regulator of sigma subunit)